MKGILFNGEMVRAILEGRKTVTRRVIKPVSKNACGFSIVSRNDGKGNYVFEDVYDADDEERMFDSPQRRIRVGDILYVRETWNKDSTANGYRYFENWSKNGIADIAKWKPSIHMPKEAARIFLKVTGVRVERLQDITPEQAIREGIKPFSEDPTDCVRDFGYLWDSTIKKSDLDRYGWDVNPFVWVIEFEKCEKPESEE